MRYIHAGRLVGSVPLAGPRSLAARWPLAGAAAACLLVLPAASGCGDDDTQGAITKAEAAAIPVADWPEDYCDTQGWYGDGECDTFCPQTDTDCVPVGTCADDVPCQPNEVCDLESCEAGASGVCVAAPEACPDVYLPVCGCDGVTYSNDCDRLMAGAALDHDGPCEQPQPECGGIAGLTCAPGEVCDMRECGADIGGVCVPAPEFCAEIYAPVCGCDGVTYGNDCERLAAGAALAYEGACDEPNLECGGLAGLTCEAGETCDIQGCAVDMGGLCVPTPEACVDVYLPVCGCDGVTYSNDCDRLMAGAALDHDGPCEQPEPECGGIAGLVCAPGEVCDMRECGADIGGVCVPAPEACYELWDPVCGCDGVTYPNDCYRLMAGVGFASAGVCAP